MMEKGKDSEFPEGRGGGKGSGIREADSDDRGFPLNKRIKCNCRHSKRKREGSQGLEILRISDDLSEAKGSLHYFPCAILL